MVARLESIDFRRAISHLIFATSAVGLARGKIVLPVGVLIERRFWGAMMQDLRRQIEEKIPAAVV
jgi:hypothetical protein